MMFGKILLINLCLPLLALSITLSDTNYLFAELFSAANAIDALNHYSCENTCGGRKKLCYCDNKCELFGDCCFDYWYQCDDSTYKNTEILSALNDISSLITKTIPQYGATIVIVDRSNILTSETFFGYYYFFYFGLGKSTCPSGASGLNKDACANNIQTNASSDKLLVAHYDTANDVMYKNYYCAKCNGVPDGDLTPMDYVISCSSLVLDALKGQEKVTLDSLGEFSSYCDLIYDLPQRNNTILRYKDLYQDKWNTGNITTSSSSIASSILNTLNGLIPKVGVEDVRNTLLCSLYKLPVYITASKLAPQDGLVFRNIHCLKSWLTKSGFELSSFKSDTSSALSIMAIIKEQSYVQISLLDSVSYMEYAIPVYYKRLRDINTLIDIYKTQTNSLSLQDPTESSQVENSNKPFRTFDSTIRELTQSETYSYFLRQAEDVVDTGIDALSTYNFTIHLQVYLSRDVLYLVLSQHVNILQQLPNEMVTVYYEAIVKNYFIDFLIKRYKLDRFQVGAYSTKTTYDKNINLFHDCIIDVNIPIAFKVRNVQVLNKLVFSLVDILEEVSYLHYYLFEIHPYPMISQVELLNNIYDYAASTYTKGTYCDSMDAVNKAVYSAQINTYTTFKQIYMVNIEKTISNSSMFKIHKAGSINDVKNFNKNSLDYQRFYRYLISLSQREEAFYMNICYDTELEDRMFLSYDRTNDQCALGNILYSFENEFLASCTSVEGDKWGIAYEFNNKTYQTIIKAKSFSKLADSVFLLCINESENAIHDGFDLFNQRYASSPTDFKCVTPIFDGSSVKCAPASNFILFVLALLTLLL